MKGDARLPLVRIGDSREAHIAERRQQVTKIFIFRGYGLRIPIAARDGNEENEKPSAQS